MSSPPTPAGLPVHSGPIAWMAQNTVAANLLMFFLFAAGILGATQVEQALFPPTNLDIIAIQTVYPGAGPAEIEQSILLPIEEQVSDIQGTRRMSSEAVENVGLIKLELRTDADPEKALAEVKSAVDNIKTLPDGAEKPNISRLAVISRVVTLVIHGDQPLEVVDDAAETARERLLAHPGVSRVVLLGNPTPEIAVEITREALEAHGLTLGNVADIMAASSLELPAGSIQDRNGDILMRVADRKMSTQAMEDIILRSTPSGASVRLGDIATVSATYVDDQRVGEFNGERAVRIRTYRVGTQTPQEVSSAVREVAEELERDYRGAVHFSVWKDDSVFLTDRIELMERNAGSGYILVLFVLALFLNLRLGFWVNLGIPISFLGAFAVLPFVGAGINMVTLFAFIITLGMVVDDAIVVGENIYEKRTEGLPPLRAAIVGAQEMAGPVTFSVLTTIASFLPMLFMPGPMGKMFGHIPLIVIPILFFSLLESFFILPAHLAHTRMVTLRDCIKVGEGIDATILTRVLSDVACADGRIMPQEQELFDRFTDGVITIDDANAQPVTAEELQTLAPRSRESVLMVAYAVAQCDDDFSPEEVERTEFLRQELGIDVERATELREVARDLLASEKPVRGLAWASAMHTAAVTGMDNLSNKVLRPFLCWATPWRYSVLAAMIATLIGSFAYVRAGLIKVEFFPSVESELVVAYLAFPHGSPLERTQAAAEAVSEAAHRALARLDATEHLRGQMVLAGEESTDILPPELGSHFATVRLELSPGIERSFDNATFVKLWREETPNLLGIETLRFESALPVQPGSPVHYVLKHRDPALLAEAASVLEERLSHQSELESVENSWSLGKPQFDFQVRPEATASGLYAADVANQLRSSFFGVEAIREQRGRREVTTTVRLPQHQRASEYDLDAQKIRVPSGRFVPVHTVADSRRGHAPVAIARENGRRVIHIKADVVPGLNLDEVRNRLWTEVIPEVQEQYPALHIDLGGQQQAEVELLNAIAMTYAVALFIIYALLAVPFKSYVQPFIVMAAIPFGFIGAIGGHIFMQYDLSLVSLLGIIALSGVVVNDSLVLVSTANDLRQEGFDAVTAIIDASARRLRPIALTSITTFLGLMPMIFETSPQAKFLIPMAIALGFGILFATVVIVVCVPFLYLAIEDLKRLMGFAEESYEHA